MTGNQLFIFFDVNHQIQFIQLFLVQIARSIQHDIAS